MPKQLTSEKKTFKSKFDPSMSILYKAELERRKNSRVIIKRHKSKNKFSAKKENGELAILNGRYAFITVNGETRAWPIVSTSHNDTCHFALSDFAQLVEYAGEVTFSRYISKDKKKKAKPDNAQCEKFDNASGTYRPDAEQKAQAGFPVEKYVAPTFKF
ncbi:MAG: hypothetical protein BGO43_04795 [Gammaproteobacteria bacterium 39-13]|nr:hypothetical protein [Gammaproteobacteria bacterium]OJV96170.1 MAG: hypothetical protein BGO43_04795 [Gammaproteobacteria bacterium 39-13]